MNQAKYQLGTLTEPDRQMIRRFSHWFIALGCVLAIFGILGLFMTAVFSVAAAILVGWSLLLGGILATAHAIIRRGWNGFLVDFSSGIFTTLIGALIVGRPMIGLAVITAFIGFVILASGVLLLALSLTRSNPYGTWTLAHGLIDVLLGVMIIAEWPLSSEWVLGTLVAVELVITGGRLIALGLAVRQPTTD